VIRLADNGSQIVARDCSPIPISGREDEEWLRRLVISAKPADLLLQIGGRGDILDDEPLATFDGISGKWWAGRYVGEIQFEGRTLRLEPRFGMPALLRWLTAIWGVRLVDSKGKFEQQRIWLWLVIAHLWSGRLIVAAKHGVPYRRVETIHEGRALRGKLLARETALARAVGDDRLVSLTRTRIVDPVIGRILLAAFERLSTALGSRGERNFWLPDRGRTVIEDLRSALGSQAARDAPRISAQSIRYSPITEVYRPIVDLSISILAQRPRTAASGGESKAFGVLLDMAEIWELYVAKLLQIALPGLRVSHTGRSTDNFRYLLTSVGGETLGSLRPDILILDSHDRCLGIADAKYKTNRINSYNRTGVVTEDLYQLAAYLSGFGDPGSRLDGFLIYPADEEGQVFRRLSPKNPWTLTSAPQRNLWFLATDGGADARTDTATLTEAERELTSLIQTALEAPRPSEANQGGRHHKWTE